MAGQRNIPAKNPAPYDAGIFLPENGLKKVDNS